MSRTSGIPSWLSTPTSPARPTRPRSCATTSKYALSVLAPVSVSSSRSIQNDLTYGSNNDHTVELFTNSSKPITAYAGPAPPAGSGPHRYVVLAYVQPTEFAPPASLAVGAGVGRIERVEAHILFAVVADPSLVVPTPTSPKLVSLSWGLTTSRSRKELSRLASRSRRPPAWTRQLCLRCAPSPHLCPSI